MTADEARSAADATSDAERLVAIAAAILPPSDAVRRPQARELDAFVQLLRDWVVDHHDLPGPPGERIERTHLQLHAMTSATSLEHALALLTRFRPLIWKGRRARVERDGDGIMLLLDQPHRPGIAGLLSELWSLSFTLTELEFLVGGPIAGARGLVRSEAGLQSAMAPLLFDRPLAYGAPELTLWLPAAALVRPVVARGDQVGAFLRQLMPRTVGVGAPPAEAARLVAAVVRADRLHRLGPVATLGTVATQLGYSAATLRRRLAAEGTSFRAVREQVYDDLATLWLLDGERVDAVADRLGYSDGFAFRRAFHRRHGCSPTAYRAAHQR